MSTMPDTAAAESSGPFSPDAAQADLIALYQGLQSAHYDLYSNRSKAEYDALFDETLRSLDAPLTRLELWQRLQGFTAFGNVAHARIDFPADIYSAFRENGGKAFPIYLRIVDGRAYVGENFSGTDAVSPGDEILAIDDVPMSEWLARTARYLSADTPYIAHSQLESAFPMYLWLELGERESYVLKLRKNNNRAMDIKIPGLARDNLQAEIDRAPAFFSLDYNSRDARMLANGIAYLRPGPFYNVENPEQLWNNTDVTAFVDAAFEAFLEADATSLIIDLRNNPGGDNSFSDPMIAWIADRPFSFASEFLVRSSDEAAASNQARLAANPGAAEGVSGRYAIAFENTPRGEVFEFDIPLATPRDGERFEGDVYVLVNRNSYSNAVNTAAIFQDYGWGSVAGELTADFATTYGAMEHFTLPNTAFKVDFPKALIIRPSGDTQPGGVQPDVVLETPIAPAANDEVLDQLVARIVAD
jgi:hypothetical protein